MKLFLWTIITCLAISSCTSQKKGRVGKEKIPDIAGTWYENDNKELPCYIVQNQRELVFMSGKETANGYFKSSMEVFAKDWNRNAILSNDKKTLRWADRKWTKKDFPYPNIAGIWYENGEAAKKIIITQTNTRLVMDNGSQKLNGYFYTTNAIYSLENNNYATYVPSSNTITWSTKTWTKKAKS